MATLPPEVPPRRRNQYPSGSEHMPSYYHPCVKNLDQVKQLMVQYVGKEGAFIIRNSFSRPGSFTASVMHGEGIKHFNIVKNGSSYFVQEQRFNSLEDVVEYFKSHEVPNQEGVKHVMLRHGIPCNCVSSPSSPSTPISNRSGFSTSMFDLGTSASGSSTLPPSVTLFPSRAESTSSADSGAGAFHGRPDVVIPTHRPKSRSIFPFFGGKSKHGVKHSDKSKRHTRHEMDIDKSILNRPPCPLPSYTHREGNPPEYEEVRDTEKSRLDELLNMLRVSGGEGAEKCECGLTIDESELPGGWSMHISHDDKTKGRLFFMGPVNGQTSWNLPLEVSLTLCPDDQDRIRAVKSKCDDLQEQYRLQMLAKSEAGAQHGSDSSSFSTTSGMTSGHQNSGFMADEGGASGGSSYGAPGGPAFVSTNGNGPVQHNVYTGSTTGVSPAVSSAGGLSMHPSY